MSGLAAAGGCITFKYIITVTQRPTDSPKEIAEIPIYWLNKIPIMIEIKWPKKTFLALANSLSWKTNKIKAVEPNENVSQTPIDESKVNVDNMQITKATDNPIEIGLYVFIWNFLFK